MTVINLAYFSNFRLHIGTAFLIACSGCTTMDNTAMSQGSFQDKRQSFIGGDLESCAALATLYLTYDSLTEIIKPDELKGAFATDALKEITDTGVMTVKNTISYVEKEGQPRDRPQIISETISSSKKLWASLNWEVEYDLALRNSRASLDVSSDVTGTFITKLNPNRPVRSASINSDAFNAYFSGYVDKVESHISSIYENSIDAARRADFSQSDEFLKLNANVNLERQRLGLPSIDCTQIEERGGFDAS